MTPFQQSLLSKNSQILNEIYGNCQAVRLAELSARTSTICALTGLSQGKVRQIIIAISNRVPPKGRAVENLDTYIKNKKHRRHVSFIIQNYRRAINFGVNHVEAIIQSYTIYQETLVQYSDLRSYIDIDHAYFLIQETNKKIDFDMSECSCCKSKFFYYKYELPLICPFCTDKKDMAVPQKLPSQKTSKAA